LATSADSSQSNEQPDQAVYASSQTAETVYPEASLFTDTLNFSSLNDFSVYNDTFALAGSALSPVTEAEKNNGFYLYQDGAYTFHASPSQHEIVRVEYDSEGILYFSDGQASYRYPDDSVVTHTFAPFSTSVEAAPYYYFINENNLYAFDTAHPLQGATLCGQGYVKIIENNGTIYALNNNLVYTIQADSQTAYEFRYVNYERAQSIAVGNTFALIQSAASTPTFVNIAAGSYVSAIDLDASKDSADGYFVVDKTYRTTGETRMVLLLCETGNAWLYATKEGCYLTLKPENAEYNTATVVTKSFEGFTNAACGVYALPYLAESVNQTQLTLGSSVKVVGMLERQTYTNLSNDWYVVQYTDENGQTIQGYLPTGLIYEYSFAQDGKDYQEQATDYSESNLVRTAILIMAVVVLVLLTFGYLTFVATKKSKQSRKGKPSRQSQEDSQSE
jgi:hypothetical protein